MKKIILISLLCFTSSVFAEGIKNYRDGKYQAYQILKDYKFVFATDKAKKLQGQQAKLMHDMAYAVSKNDPNLKAMLQQKEAAYRFGKENNNMADYFAVIAAIERYVIENVKDNEAFSQAYQEWNQTTTDLESYRISVISPENQDSLTKIYTYLQDQRRSQIAHTNSI